MAGRRLRFVDVNSASYRAWLQSIRLGDEREVSAFLAATLRPGDSFIDVGSYVGGFALLAAKLIEPGGHVLAFEPDPANAATLRANVAANGASEVVVVAAAVADHVGTVEIRARGDSTSAITADSGSTPCTTVDRYCAEHGFEADVIKVDVEGAEEAVLRPLGAARALARARALVVEVHGFAGVRLEMLESYTEAAGLRTVILGERDRDNFHVAFVRDDPSRAQEGGARD